MEADETDRVLDLLEHVKGYHGWHAVLPPLVRARRVRLGRDAHQWPQHAGLQERWCATWATTITVEPHPGPEGGQGPDRGYGAVLRQLQEGAARTSSTTARCPQDGKERLQSPEQRDRFDDTTKCILCAACTTSCPSFWASDEYLGPAALVTAHRFIFDSRDEGAAERLHDHQRDERPGALPHHLSTAPMACPRDIQITKAIGELKMSSLTGRID